MGRVEPPSGSFVRSMGYPEWNGMEWNGKEYEVEKIVDVRIVKGLR